MLVAHLHEVIRVGSAIHSDDSNDSIVFCCVLFLKV